MISLKELNPKGFPTTEEIQANLSILHERINKVRIAWAKPMIVTSGLRSIEDHKRIYREKGISEDKIPMGSRHLHGQACDISDPDGKLYDWCKANEVFLAEIELWMEIKDSEPRVHFQIVPPKSGNRFFIP